MTYIDGALRPSNGAQEFVKTACVRVAELNNEVGRIRAAWAAGLLDPAKLEQALAAIRAQLTPLDEAVRYVGHEMRRQMN